MQTTTELSVSDLLSIPDIRSAGDAIETVIDLRAYLPADGLLVLLAGRFRDDMRERLGMPTRDRVERGDEVKPLSEMSDGEFIGLLAAVELLLGRFTRWMDAPELIALLSGLHEPLRIEANDRAVLKEKEEASAS